MTKEALIDAYRDHLSRLDGRTAWHTAVIRHDEWSKPTSTSDPIKFATATLVGDYKRDMINTLNEWRHRIEALDVWADCLPGHSNEDQFALLYEFVHPLAELALGRAFQMQQRYVFCTVKLLDMSGVYARAGKSCPPDHRITLDVLREVATAEWDLEGIVSDVAALNSSEFTTATAEYRNRAQHRVAPHIEIGISWLVSRRLDENRRLVIGFGSEEPLSLARVVPVLREEHRRAATLFERFAQFGDALMASGPEV